MMLNVTSLCNQELLDEMSFWETMQGLDDSPTSDELVVAMVKIKWGKVAERCNILLELIATLWRPKIITSIIGVNEEDMDSRICG